MRLTLFGEFSAVRTDGSEIPLTSQKARALLAFLALPLGKPRSREAIMALLWSDRGEEQARASLRQVLSGLRKALGEDVASILNTEGEFLSLNPDRVIIVGADTGEVFLADVRVNDPAFEEWLRDERLRLEGEDPGFVSSTEQVDKPSVAVLPFLNLSGDPDQDYFSDGISEDIITELSRFQHLRVIARSSSFSFREQDLTAPQIAEALRVDYLVEGSVQRGADRIRITAQLIDCKENSHLWSEKIDGSFDDVFAFQDKAVLKIVMSITHRIDHSGDEKSRRKPPESMEVFEHYLRAKNYLDNPVSAADLDRSRAHWNRVLALSPDNARAHAGMALTYSVDLYLRETGEVEKQRKLALEFSEAGVALDPMDSYCHWSLSEAAYHNDQLDRALRHIRKANAINPNDADILLIWAWTEAAGGNPERGLELVGQALNRNPYPPILYHWLHGNILFCNGQFDAAADALALYNPPNQSVLRWRAAAEAQAGRLEKAQESVRELQVLNPDYIASDVLKLIYDPVIKDRLVDGLRKAGLPG